MSTLESLNQSIPAARRPGMSLSMVITRIIWLCMLPLFLFASGMAIYTIGVIHREQAKQAADLAKGFVSILNGNLEERIKALNMLAMSPLVDDRSRWDELHREALGFYQNFGTHVVISDGGMPTQLLLNTRALFGTKLPVVEKPNGRLAGPIAMKTGKPAVSDLFAGPVAHEPLVGIAVPVLRNGKAKYAIVTTIDREFFQKLMDQVALPPGWSMILKDAQAGTIAGRMLRPIEDTAFRSVVESQVSHWTVAVGVSRYAHWWPLVSIAIVLSLALIGVTLASFLGGKWASRRLGRAVASLTEPMAPEAPAPDISEIAAVRRLLDEEGKRRATAEVTLRESEKRYRELVQNANSAIIRWKGDGTITFFNEYAQAFFGYTEEEVVGKHVGIIVPEKEPTGGDLNSLVRDIVIHPERFTHNINENICRDGHRVWMSWTNKPLFGENGGVREILAVGADITERKKAEEALRESERRLSMAISATADAIWEWSLVTDQTYYSPRWYEMLGYEENEVPMNFDGWKKLCHPEDFQPTIDLVTPSLKSARDQGYAAEFRMRTKAGSWLWILGRGRVVERDEAGNPVLLSGTNTDISERKAAEEALRLSEERFAKAFASNPSAICLTELADSRIVDANPAFTRIFGYTREEFTGSTILELGLWPTRQDRETAVRELQRHGFFRDRPQTMLTKSGEAREFLSSAETIIVGGKPMIVSTWLDITKRKQAEAALRESEQRFRLALRKAPVSVAAQDRDLRYIWAFNQRTAKPEDIIGHTDQELFAPDEAAHVTAIKRRVLEENVELHEQMWFSRPGGRIFLDLTWEPIRDQAGRVTGVASATVDLTPIKLAEEALKSSLAEKEVLLKEIHHRVKNNMQVISSLVDLQAEEVEDAAMRAVLKEVIHRVRSMALVHEKLYQSADLARVQLDEYVQSLLNYLWRSHGTASDIRLVPDLEPVSLSAVAAVPCGLILNELVSNALKHAFGGRTDGEVGVSVHGGPEGEVRLIVRDNGRGLPEGFDWTQGRSLGLRLVQMLAGQLHASVEVSGEKGTQFTIIFTERNR